MARRHVELCRRLSREGVVVSTVGSPAASSFDAGEPYPIHRQVFEFPDAKVLLNQMRWARSLVRDCRRGVHVVHCANIRPCGYSVRWAQRLTRLPYLLYVNGGDLLRELRKIKQSALKRRTARSILCHSSGIVANSIWTGSVAGALASELGVRPPPICTIDLGTDPAQFNPSRDRGVIRERFGIGRAPLLVTVARLVPHKGQDVAIAALALLSPEFPELRYLVIGDGIDAPRLRELADSSGVGSRVILAGSLPDDEVADAYATATIYVGLSRVDDGVNVEGFGISFVEAAASGVPSVAGDSGGVRSAVRDDDTGFVVPPTDAAAAARAIGRLLRDEVLRAHMGAAARFAVETHYNWDRVARETLAFTREVVARRHGR
jgi:glycosyltransferase involved in cell wall biosynthesis